MKSDDAELVDRLTVLQIGSTERIAAKRIGVR
jgi:hypothetical protein